MATVLVKFKVTGAPGMVYAIDVDGTDIPLGQGAGSIRLPKGEEAMLRWWMFGNPGEPLAILGKVGEAEVVNVKASRIPEGRRKGSGFRVFTP